MAAPITTSATTLEGQLVEVAKALQEAELAIPDVNRPNNVSVGLDPETLTITVTGTLEATLSGAGGSVTLAPVAYLP